MKCIYENMSSKYFLEQGVCLSCWRLRIDEEETDGGDTARKSPSEESFEGRGRTEGRTEERTDRGVTTSLSREGRPPRAHRQVGRHTGAPR